MPSVKQVRINANKNVNTHGSWYSQDYSAINTVQSNHRNCAIQNQPNIITFWKYSIMQIERSYMFKLLPLPGSKYFKNKLKVQK